MKYGYSVNIIQSLESEQLTEEELALLKEMVFSGKSKTAITAKLKR